MRTTHLPAHYLGLPRILRERLAPRRLLGLSLPTLHDRMVPLIPALFASSDEADSEDSTLVPQFDVPATVAYQPNRWCIEGQYQVYRDDKLLNDKEVTDSDSNHQSMGAYMESPHDPSYT